MRQKMLAWSTSILLSSSSPTCSKQVCMQFLSLCTADMVNMRLSCVSGFHVEGVGLNPRLTRS